VHLRAPAAAHSVLLLQQVLLVGEGPAPLKDGQRS
jgi:hypothetical protein